MTAKCIENKLNNSNFTIGKEYKITKICICINCGNILYIFNKLNNPNITNKTREFEFGMCKFKTEGLL